MSVAFHGLDLELHADVYGPREDTELMLRALDLHDVAEGDRACDVGTGTGALALALARRGARVLATDVNPAAIRLARANAHRNGLAARVDAVRASLLAPLRGPFDLVVFNPPYLPVEGELPGELPKSWEGGLQGLGWAPLFLAGLHRCLAPGGRALVAVSSLGRPGAFAALAASRGFVAQAVASAKLPWETLQAVQVQRGNL
ncbi:MAG TPA: HemK2/MTQ2 family protein methyltransferase [Candidatus Thermoplasmatota archaeon]|nr:HemK2/MTQ2 family protein methyltransferase [Candidatus Thermoplasmatota archaeon]